jgi:hypothetical protein
MPITLGILAQSRQAPVAAGSYDLLETVLVGSTPAATVTFSNLNSTYGTTYKHLQVRWTGRSNRSGQTVDRLFLKFNGDNGNNVFTHSLFGNGSSVSSGSGWGTTEPRVLFESALTGASATASSFSAGTIDLLDAFVTTKNTTIRSLYGNQADRISLTSAVYLNTAAITTLEFSAIASFVEGTRFSIYGVKG